MLGPYVEIAAFCEEVVEEEDGCVSLKHVSDRTEAWVDRATGARVLGGTVYLGVRSGDLSGPHTVHIALLDPIGRVAFETDPLPAQFEGGLSGVHLQMRFQGSADNDGIYWFEIFLDKSTAPLFRWPLQVGP